MAERDERLYLTEILEAIDRATRYCAGGRSAFFADHKTRDAVVRNIEIIWEVVEAELPRLRHAVATLLPKA